MRIYVGNLPFNMTEDDVREMFEAFGAVQGVDIISDRETGRSRGFGFVEMTDEGEARKAIDELHEKDCGGRPLTVNMARPRTERGARGGRGSSEGNRW